MDRLNNRDLGRASTLCLVIGGGLAVLLGVLTPWAASDSMEAVKLICIIFGFVALPLIIIGIKLRLRYKQDYSAKRMSMAEAVKCNMKKDEDE